LGLTLCSWYFFDIHANDAKKKDFRNKLRKEVITESGCSPLNFRNFYEDHYPHMITSFSVNPEDYNGATDEIEYNINYIFPRPNPPDPTILAATKSKSKSKSKSTKSAEEIEEEIKFSGVLKMLKTQFKAPASASFPQKDDIMESVNMSNLDYSGSSRESGAMNDSGMSDEEEEMPIDKDAKAVKGKLAKMKFSIVPDFATSGFFE